MLADKTLEVIFPPDYIAVSHKSRNHNLHFTLTQSNPVGFLDQSGKDAKCFLCDIIQHDRIATVISCTKIGSVTDLMRFRLSLVNKRLLNGDNVIEKILRRFREALASVS